MGDMTSEEHDRIVHGLKSMARGARRHESTMKLPPMSGGWRRLGVRRQDLPQRKHKRRYF